jgi:hypothetical protein
MSEYARKTEAWEAADQERKAKAVVMLDRARALLMDPKRWTHGTYARDAKGHDVSAYSKEAERFCAMGALRHVGQSPDGLSEGFSEAMGALHRQTVGRDITVVNDIPQQAQQQFGTTRRKAVLLAYGKAIEELSSQIQS